MELRRGVPLTFKGVEGNMVVKVEAGVRVSDDVQAGRSSLRYFEHLPVFFVKNGLKKCGTFGACILKKST